MIYILIGIWVVSICILHEVIEIRRNSVDIYNLINKNNKG